MQGKLDILAENVEEDGFVAGVCFLQDDSGEGSAFFKTTPLSGAPGRGAFLGSCCPLRFQKSPVEAPHPEALRLLEDDFAGVRPVTVENL